MRNRKLLYVLIPLIIVALILVVGVIYLKLNSGPEKIFEHSINKVFSLFESSLSRNPLNAFRSFFVSSTLFIAFIISYSADFS